MENIKTFRSPKEEKKQEGKYPRAGVMDGKTAVMDATFTKAYSKRHPHENSRGSTDLEARVGRKSKTCELGYKLHGTADAKSELPLAVIAAPANENKHASTLFDKALKTTMAQVKTLVADSPYSCRRLRNHVFAHGARAVIPYPADQRREEKRLLEWTDASGLTVQPLTGGSTGRGQQLSG